MCVFVLGPEGSLGPLPQIGLLRRRTEPRTCQTRAPRDVIFEIIAHCESDLWVQLSESEGQTSSIRSVTRLLIVHIAATKRNLEDLAVGPGILDHGSFGKSAGLAKAIPR